MLKAIGYGTMPLLVVVLLSYASYQFLKDECSIKSPIAKLNRIDDPSKTSDADKQNFSAERETDDWGHKFLCETKVGEFSLAVLTLALVVVTGMLWFATDRLVKGADETAKKQLRAYIGVEPRDIIRLEGDEFLIGHYAIRNVGSIPAKNIAMFAVTDYRQGGNERGFKIGDLYKTTIGLVPNAEMEFGTSTVTGINVDCLADDTSEESVSGVAGYVYVYGKVTYTDEFGTEGWTEFCHRYPCARLEEGVGACIDRKYARYHEIEGNNAG